MGTGTGAGTGAGTGMGMGVKARGQTRDGNGDGSWDGHESSSGDGNGDEDRNGDRNKEWMGEGGGEAKKRKKPHKRCRRDVGKEGDLGGKRKTKHRQQRVISVPTKPDNLENSMEAGGKAQGIQDLRRTRQVENVCPLCRV